MVLGSHKAKPVKAFLKAEKAEDVLKFSWYLKQRRKGYYWLHFCSVTFFHIKVCKREQKKREKRKRRNASKAQR